MGVCNKEYVKGHLMHFLGKDSQIFFKKLASQIETNNYFILLQRDSNPQPPSS